jgi:NADH-quinone oxidoreductase subunit H
MAGTALTTVVWRGGWQPLFAVRMGSNYVASLVFAIAGAFALYHGLQPARRLDRLTLPGVAIVFFIVAAVFAIPVVQSILIPVFWFAAKTGFLVALVS